MQMEKGMVIAMNSKIDIIRDFEEKGDDYYKLNYLIKNKANYLRRLRRRLILKEIGDIRDDITVLDVGCGPAILFPELLNKAKRYCAVDMVKANLERIKSSGSWANLECIHGDMDEIDNSLLNNRQFDVIICSGSIEYTNNPEKNLLQLIGFLREGGILICSFPNLLSPYRLWSEYVYNIVLRVKDSIFRKKFIAYKRKLFSANKILEIVAKGKDVKSINVIYFGHKFIPQPLDIIFERLDYRLNIFLQEHLHRLFEKHCIEFLIKIVK